MSASSTPPPLEVSLLNERTSRPICSAWSFKRAYQISDSTQNVPEEYEASALVRARQPEAAQYQRLLELQFNRVRGTTASRLNEHDMALLAEKTRKPGSMKDLKVPKAELGITLPASTIEAANGKCQGTVYIVRN